MYKRQVAGIWAAGDVNGVSMLAHTAYREAEVAVNNILGKRDVMSYDVIPAVIYTNPEVGSVGLTLEAAKERGITAKAVSYTHLMPTTRTPCRAKKRLWKEAGKKFIPPLQGRQIG